MIKIITNGDNSILELEVGEKVTEEDYEKIESELEKKIDEFGQVDLLVRMDDIPNMSIGAIVQDFNLSFKHLKDIGEIAVVGDSDTLKALVKAEDFIPGINVRYFDYEDIDNAWNCLKA